MTLPRDGHHGTDDGDEKQHVGPHGGESADGCLRADHVGVHAAEQRTGLGAGEEGERQLLNVAEHAHPQVEDQSLADARAEPARHGSQGRFAECERDGETEQDVDLTEVAVGDGHVDQATEHQRRRGRDQRRGRDAREVEEQLGAVGMGEAPGPLQGVAVHRRCLVAAGELHHRNAAVDRMHFALDRTGGVGRLVPGGQTTRPRTATPESGATAFAGLRARNRSVGVRTGPRATMTTSRPPPGHGQTRRRGWPGR